MAAQAVLTRSACRVKNIELFYEDGKIYTYTFVLNIKIIDKCVSCSTALSQSTNCYTVDGITVLSTACSTNYSSMNGVCKTCT